MVNEMRTGDALMMHERPMSVACWQNTRDLVIDMKHASNEKHASITRELCTGGKTRTELHEATGITRTLIFYILLDMMKCGQVEWKKRQRTAPSRGRHRIEFSLTETFMKSAFFKERFGQNL